MIYPITIGITLLIALIGAFGGFDAEYVSDSGYKRYGLDIGMTFIVFGSALWGVIGVMIFALASNDYADKLATLETSKAFIEPAEQRLEGLKDHYANMLPQFKELPQEILANEDSPMSSAIRTIGKAESDLEDARNKYNKAKIKVEGYNNSPIALIYKRNPPTYS